MLLALSVSKNGEKCRPHKKNTKKLYFCTYGEDLFQAMYPTIESDPLVIFMSHTKQFTIANYGSFSESLYIWNNQHST